MRNIFPSFWRGWVSVTIVGGVSMIGAWTVSSFVLPDGFLKARIASGEAVGILRTKDPHSRFLPPGEDKAIASAIFASTNDDDFSQMDLAEEEFYQDYENLYSSTGEERDRETPTKSDQDSTQELLPIEANDPVAKSNEEPVSSLSELQQRLQQITEKARNPTSPVDNENATILDESSVNDDARRTNDQPDVDRDINDRYKEMLRKAEERLSTMKPSSFNRKSQFSNLSGLEERLKELQKGTTATAEGDLLPTEGRKVDDETLAEWEELDEQLQREATEISPSANASQESLILEALRKKFPKSDGGLLDKGESLSDGNERNVKNAQSSGFDVDEDGDVFLSPEAYIQACETVNADGSLNFSNMGKTFDHEQESLPISSNDEANKDDAPMAPYAQNDGSAASDYTGDDRVVTIEDLAKLAQKSIAYARDHPEAQEALHQKILEEYEAEEPPLTELEQEILMDPEKAAAFWNQEYLEQQKQESKLLDDLLDEKLEDLKKEEETIGPNSKLEPPLSTPQGTGRKLQYTASSDRNIFFASREQRVHRRRMIERNRRDRAETIAKFYESSGEDSSWNLTSESKEIERMDGERNDDDQKSFQPPKTEIPSEADTKRTVESSGTHSSDSNIDSKGEWVLVEDPEAPLDSFYWNEVTGEMRWDTPEGQ